MKNPHSPFPILHSPRAGITLLEVLIASALSIGLLLILTRFVGVVGVTQRFLNNRLQALTDANLAVQTIVTEIRSMGQSSTGAYPIESAATSSLVFYSDIDRNGLMERVRYTISSSSLQKGVVKPTGNPLSYVTSTEVVTTALANLMRASSSFAYFDTNYTGTGSPLASTTDVTVIRVVQAKFTVDVSTSSAPKPISFTETITIRNLKTN